MVSALKSSPSTSKAKLIAKRRSEVFMRGARRYSDSKLLEPNPSRSRPASRFHKGKKLSANSNPMSSSEPLVSENGT